MRGPKYFLPDTHQLLLHWDPLGYLTGLRNRYGDFVEVQNGKVRVYLISDPALISELLVSRANQLGKARGLRMARRILGEGLLTSEGEFHHRQRKLMQPGFQPQRVARFEQAIVTAASQLSSGWCDGATVDCLGDLNRLTLTIVGRALFDSDFEHQAALITGLLNHGRRLFRWGYFLFPLLEWLERLPPVRRLILQKRQRIDDIVYPIIHAHRKKVGIGMAAPDLLSMMLEAGMGDEAVRDEVVTLLLAGNETTANSLAWTLYLLADHPAIQQSLQAELDLILAGRPPSVEDLPRLTRLRNVFLESLRLFPPNWMIARVALENFQLGDSEIPRGATCLVSQYVLHRNERWFPQAEHFDPDRWVRQPRSVLPRHAYLPFGAGPRKCIGEHFAMMESELILATLLQQWSFQKVPGQTIVPDPAITLRPRPGPLLRLRRRLKFHSS